METFQGQVKSQVEKLQKYTLRDIEKAVTAKRIMRWNNQPGLDTPQVCRKGYEKSTQAFISQLYPQLRFVRSYSEIRPYAEFCRQFDLKN